jgi:hypothetical protein
MTRQSFVPGTVSVLSEVTAWLTIFHPCLPKRAAALSISANASLRLVRWPDQADVYSYCWGYQLPSEASHQPGPGEGVLMAGILGLKAHDSWQESPKFKDLPG